MPNLTAYYTQQAGSGISFYPGVRYQRGHGFFGRFFKGSLLPLLQSLGHKMLSTGVEVADDVLNKDVDPLSALKYRGKIAARDTANKLISRARSRLADTKQSGSGKRKRKSIKGCRKKKRLISKTGAIKNTSKKIKKKTPKKATKSKKIKRSKKGSTRTPVPKYLEI